MDREIELELYLEKFILEIWYAKSISSVLNFKATVKGFCVEKKKNLT